MLPALTNSLQAGTCVFCHRFNLRMLETQASYSIHAHYPSCLVIPFIPWFVWARPQTFFNAPFSFLGYILILNPHACVHNQTKSFVARLYSWIGSNELGLLPCDCFSPRCYEEEGLIKKVFVIILVWIMQKRTQLNVFFMPIKPSFCMIMALRLIKGLLWLVALLMCHVISRKHANIRLHALSRKSDTQKSVFRWSMW